MLSDYVIRRVRVCVCNSTHCALLLHAEYVTKGKYVQALRAALKQEALQTILAKWQR